MTRMARIVGAMAVVSGLVPSTLACDRMTYREALDAVIEAAISAQGESMTEDIIEVSTDFTIGGAVENAAAELATWIETQIPCSTVTLAGSTVTVDFGTLADTCVYNDHTYAGLWAVTIQRNAEDDVVVDHEWTGLTDGTIVLDGTAQVTWSADATSRRVVHGVTWTSGEHVIEASGDRLQTLIDPAAGIEAGIVVDGERDWVGTDGRDWSLTIDGVEMRGVDPVPQAGVYTLTTPDLRVVTLSFSRIDDDTIECVLTAGTRSWTFHVSRDGQVEEG